MSRAIIPLMYILVIGLGVAGILHMKKLRKVRDE